MFEFLKRKQEKQEKQVAFISLPEKPHYGDCALVTANNCAIEVVTHSCLDCKHCKISRLDGELYCSKIKIANPKQKNQRVSCNHARMVHYLCDWDARFFEEKKDEKARN